MNPSSDAQSPEEPGDTLDKSESPPADDGRHHEISHDDEPTTPEPRAGRMKHVDEFLGVIIKGLTILAMLIGAYIALSYDLDQREAARRSAQYQVDATRLQVTGSTDSGTFLSDGYNFTYLLPKITIASESMAIVDPAGVCWMATFSNFVGENFGTHQVFIPAKAVSREHAEQGRSHSCPDLETPKAGIESVRLHLNGVDTVSTGILFFQEFKRPGLVRWEARIPLLHDGTWRTYGTGDMIVLK